MRGTPSLILTLGLTLGLILLLPAGSAMSQIKEILEFSSPSRNGPVRVKAELFLPDNASGGATGRVPAMVIHHGSGGVSNTREYAYAREFTRMGVASIIPDSFTPRGVKSTVSDQAAVHANEMIADAFSLLKLAAAHPRIDPARIGITGFSKGGSVAMRTALQLMVNRHAKDGPRFALHVAFYPGCDSHYLDRRTTGAPLLVLLGGADTYTGTERCLAIVNDLKAAGAAHVEAVVYPKGQHGWDGTGKAWTVASGENSRHCFYVEQADRSWIEQTSGVTTIGRDGRAIEGASQKAQAVCRTLGVSGGPDTETAALSMEALKGAMRAAFGLR